MAEDRLRIGSHTFDSRLIVGTGKYSTYELMQEALAAAAPSALLWQSVASG